MPLALESIRNRHSLGLRPGPGRTFCKITISTEASDPARGRAGGPGCDGNSAAAAGPRASLTTLARALPVGDQNSILSSHIEQILSKPAPQLELEAEHSGLLV